MIFFSSSIDCSMISTFYGVKVFSVDEVEREKFPSLITAAAETRKAELEMEAQGVLSPLSREFSQAEEYFPCCFSIFALHLQRYIMTWLKEQTYERNLNDTFKSVTEWLAMYYFESYTLNILQSVCL